MSPPGWATAPHTDHQKHRRSAASFITFSGNRLCDKQNHDIRALFSVKPLRQSFLCGGAPTGIFTFKNELDQPWIRSPNEYQRRVDRKLPSLPP
jgi:hypothetical protein